VVNQPKEDISDCKGLRGVAMATKFWVKIGQKSKNGHNFSCKRHIHAEYGYEIGFVPSGNSSVILPYTRDKGALPIMATNLGTKFAINAYKCISTRDNENAITYNRGCLWSANPKKSFLIRGSKGRRHGNQFVAKIGKNITKMATTLVVCNISVQSSVLRQGLRYRGIHLSDSSTQGTKCRFYGNQFWD